MSDIFDLSSDAATSSLSATNGPDTRITDNWQKRQTKPVDLYRSSGSLPSNHLIT